MKNRILSSILIMCFVLSIFQTHIIAGNEAEYFSESFNGYTDSDIETSWKSDDGTISKEVLGVQRGALKLTSEQNKDASVYKEFSEPVNDNDFVIEFWIKMNCGFDMGVISDSGDTFNIIGFRPEYNKIGAYKTGSGRLSFASVTNDTSLKFDCKVWNRIRIEVDKTDKTYKVLAPFGEFTSSYTANIGNVSGIRFSAIKQSDKESTIAIDEISIYDKKTQTDIASIENKDGKLVCENLAAVTGDLTIRNDGYIVFDCHSENWADGTLKYDVDLNKGTMHIDIDNHIAESGNERGKIAVEITYLDALYPWMYIKYATEDGMNTAGYISRTNTKEDVTKTFFLPDADFNNSSSEYDLTLVSYDGFTENQTGITDRRKFSRDWNCIKKIRIYKTEEKDTFGAEITTDNVGNIFYDSETPKFDIAYKLLAKESVDLTAQYAVYEYDDNSEKSLLYVEDSKSSVEDSKTESVLMPVGKFGLYEFEVRLVDSDGNLYQSMSVPFSKCVKNNALNYDFGAAGHLTRYGDAEAKIEVLKNAGLGLFRDDFEWINYERQKGVYKFGERQRKLLELTKENNIKLLPILTGNNVNYCPESANSYSFVESNIEPFNAFMEKIVQEELFGHIEMVEIWNEPDLLTQIDGVEHENFEDRARAYAKDVKNAYNTIKSVRPDIKVGAFSLSGGLHEDYRKSFADYILDELGSEKAFDNMTLHPYMSGEDPEIGTFGEDNTDLNSAVDYRINYYRDLMNGNTKGLLTQNTYNQNNHAPMWHTEMGWSTAHHSDALCDKTESEQASLIVREYDAIKQNNFDDKVWIYEMADAGVRSYEKEDNFGIVRSHNSKVPYSAKFAYLAVSNYNRMTKGATAVTQEKLSDYVFKSKYTCDDRAVYMVWTSGEDKEASMRFAPAATYYDFYGNRISKSEIMSGTKFKVSIKPFYVVEGKDVDKNYEASVYFAKDGMIMAEPKLSDINLLDFDVTVDFNTMEEDTEYAVLAAVYNGGRLLDTVMINGVQKKDNGTICELENNTFKSSPASYDEIKLMILKDVNSLSPAGQSVMIK